MRFEIRVWTEESETPFIVSHGKTNNIKHLADNMGTMERAEEYLEKWSEHWGVEPETPTRIQVVALMERVMSEDRVGSGS